MVDVSSAVSRVSPLAKAKSAPTDQGCENTSYNGIVLTELQGQAIVQLFARQGRAATVSSVLGISDKSGVSSVTERLTSLPLAPGQWLVTANGGDDGSFATALRDGLSQDAFVSEQSHGRVIIRVSGANARALMQKGCRLDLHPSVASAGFCAQTSMAQVGVLIHQVDDQPTYDLHLYSGFALSFWHWLTTTAAQFGSR